MTLKGCAEEKMLKQHNVLLASEYFLIIILKLQLYVMFYIGVQLYIREEHSLRVLKIIFGPRRDEAIGGWKKLYEKERHNFYCSISITRMMKSKRMR
jgi:hypothetical protein